jgi:hypothetical protein
MSRRALRKACSTLDPVPNLLDDFQFDELMPMDEPIKVAGSCH